MGTMPRAVANHLSSLAIRWDENDMCRTNVREHHALLNDDAKPTFHATVKSCSENCDAILPVLALTAEPLEFENAKITLLISSLCHVDVCMFLDLCDLKCVAILSVT